MNAPCHFPTPASAPLLTLIPTCTLFNASSSSQTLPPTDATTISLSLSSASLSPPLFFSPSLPCGACPP